MTDNFYAPPHSIEAEQAVIGGLLLDDDSSERVQKVLAMLKPDSFYSRPHKILFEEITRMHREQKPVDGLTLFDELERKSLTASVGGFAYIAEIAKNTPSAANIVAYAMQVRETAMERYAINRMTEATELLYSRNGMTATQKYEAIQAIFTQLTDHAKTGSRRGLRSFGEVMEDWVYRQEVRMRRQRRSFTDIICENCKYLPTKRSRNKRKPIPKESDVKTFNYTAHLWDIRWLRERARKTR